MTYHAFTNPVLQGKVEALKNYIREMNGFRNKESNESRRRVGLTIERVWLHHTPTGEFAVVYC